MIEEYICENVVKKKKRHNEKKKKRCEKKLRKKEEKIGQEAYGLEHGRALLQPYCMKENLH